MCVCTGADGPPPRFQKESITKPQMRSSRDVASKRLIGAISTCGCASWCKIVRNYAVNALSMLCGPDAKCRSYLMRRTADPRGLVKPLFDAGRTFVLYLRRS